MPGNAVASADRRPAGSSQEVFGSPGAMSPPQSHGTGAHGVRLGLTETIRRKQTVLESGRCPMRSRQCHHGAAPILADRRPTRNAHQRDIDLPCTMSSTRVARALAAGAEHFTDSLVVGIKARRVFVAVERCSEF